MLHLKNLFKRVQNYLAQYRVYKRYRASQYISLMTQVGNVYVQSYSQFESDGVMIKGDLFVEAKPCIYTQ
jgi:hypothetical protein